MTDFATFVFVIAGFAGFFFIGVWYGRNNAKKK